MMSVLVRSFQHWPSAGVSACIHPKPRQCIPVGTGGVSEVTLAFIGESGRKMRRITPHMTVRPKVDHLHQCVDRVVTSHSLWSTSCREESFIQCVGRYVSGRCAPLTADDDEQCLPRVYRGVVHVRQPECEESGDAKPMRVRTEP